MGHTRENSSFGGRQNEVQNQKGTYQLSDNTGQVIESL